MVQLQVGLPRLSRIHRSTNGFLQFETISGATDSTNSAEQLAQHIRIAPLWDALRTDRTGDDVFVDDSVAGRVAIRWDATQQSDETDVNFAVEIFDDGRIRFDYGPGNSNLSPTIGLSRGDGENYLLATYDARLELNNAASIEFHLELTEAR